SMARLTATPTTANPDAGWRTLTYACASLPLPAGMRISRRISPGCNDVVSICAGGDEFCIERENGGRPVSSGIGVSKASADGALVADLHVAEMAGGFRQQ